MNKGLYALAAGTFGLGIVEYVMMGILPDMANGLNISITQAGHLISAYALGVCAGAPLIAIFAKNRPLRQILLGLMILFITGSLLTAVSVDYWMALTARFINGLPHGSFFGVGVIVANRMAKEGKGTSAVATMVMGMTIANLLGVPLCNLIGHHLSWRIIFAFASVWGLLTVLLIVLWIPEQAPLPKTTLKGMFRFLGKPQPWLLLMATVLGNGGIFCWYSYINPLLTDVAGFSVGIIPFFMLLAGASMCIGNYLGGKLSDRYSPAVVAMYTQGVIFVSLALIFLFASNGAVSILLMCVATACLFAVSSPQQQLLLQYSPGGEMMGGAMVQLAFNLGNAVGAYFGGIPIDKGIGVEYASLVGATLAFAGVAILVSFNRAQKGLKVHLPSALTRVSSN